MHSDPLVSVIIPCYDYGRYLSDALESIIEQTYSNWECIVVNDGSADNTEEVAGHYVQKDARIRLINQKNGGVSAARNRALQEAQGKYIQLLDADDMLEKRKLELQVALLEENLNVDLVYSSIVFFKEEDKNYRVGPQLLQNKKPVSGKGEVLMERLLDDNLFLPGCTLARKSLYNEAGSFKIGIEGIEDWDYFYRAAVLQRFFYHDEREGTRLLARSHDNNASSNSYKMLSHKILARKGLMEITKNLSVDNVSPFSDAFVQKAYRMHLALLNRDGARLNLFYGSILKGCIITLKHAYFSKKPYFAFYDSAYWIKERIKRVLMKRTKK